MGTLPVYHKLLSFQTCWAWIRAPSKLPSISKIPLRILKLLPLSWCEVRCPAIQLSDKGGLYTFV